MNLNDELTWAEQYIEERKNAPGFIQAEVMNDISDAICIALETRSISRTELARRMGCSRAYITKLLSGTYNYTIETLIKIAVALEMELKVELAPKSTAAKKKVTYDFEQPMKNVAEG